jgi:hypothetical protein
MLWSIPVANTIVQVLVASAMARDTTRSDSLYLFIIFPTDEGGSLVIRHNGK